MPRRGLVWSKLCLCSEPDDKGRGRGRGKSTPLAAGSPAPASGSGVRVQKQHSWPLQTSGEELKPSRFVKAGGAVGVDKTMSTFLVASEPWCGSLQCKYRQVILHIKNRK